MNELEKLEDQFGFKYPAIYHDLYKAGMLDWMHGWDEPWTKERNWYTEIYPTLLDNPPLLLHNRDFELYTLADIKREMETIPDYWDPQYQLVPIGMSGAGDWYAFNFTARQGNDVPIVFAPHDEWNATFLAKNMSDFIFRMMLEYAAEIDEDELENEDEFRQKIINMLQSHTPYISAEQFNILAEVYSRPFQEFDYGLTLRNPYKEMGLLGEEELNELIKKTIGFDKLDTEFKYMR